jgi:hypothetical protein
MLVFALLLALAGCGGNDEATTTPTATETETQATTTETETQTDTTEAETAKVVRVTVTNGVPVGGITRQSVDKDDRVLVVVDSDVADEIHVHGYDIKKDVAAGGTARIPFRATIPGRFEIELEGRGTQIAELTVYP